MALYIKVPREANASGDMERYMGYEGVCSTFAPWKYHGHMVHRVEHSDGHTYYLVPSGYTPVWVEKVQDRWLSFGVKVSVVQGVPGMRLVQQVCQDCGIETRVEVTCRALVPTVRLLCRGCLVKHVTGDLADQDYEVRSL